GRPPLAVAREWFFRVVARHRDVFDRITRWIWGDHLVPPGNRITSWIFMRVLGVTFLVAMLSLWSQVIGLVGHDGILPATTFLHGVAERYGAVRLWFLPTLC